MTEVMEVPPLLSPDDLPSALCLPAPPPLSPLVCLKSVLCLPAPPIPSQLGELPSSLKPRLGDSNKNLTVQALGLLAKLARWVAGRGDMERLGEDAVGWGG